MRLLLGVIVVVFFGCKEKEGVGDRSMPEGVFKEKRGDSTGIRFVNELKLSEDFDVFRYRNYYNGGGVGLGDFNNDGLLDVYLTSNMGSNKLFLNRGGWKFEDISEKAGVEGTKAWSTGVSVVDVNADGLLDIYVCNSGDINGLNRENELFINQGDLTFKEEAAKFGLNDNGYSTHAAFFDYDRDGDLDCYILNNSFRPIATLGYRNFRNERDVLGGDKLLRNDNGFFVDVSESAGIFGSVIGFGLGITVGDVNGDNWPDIYISNDFYERDYLYINQHDGTFHEQLEDYFTHISMFSMGADMADLNNDTYLDIFSTDMLPVDDRRLKVLSSFESYDTYQLRLKNGYYHQFMKNMLHINNHGRHFTEFGEMARVAATDWSWGCLIADFDNDSYKEIFVCNGIYKDVTDQDFIDYMGSNEQIKAAMEGKKIDFQKFVDRMSSTPLSNVLFKRISDWEYVDVAEKWGLGTPSFSNGAAYGDCDNDGDLDLIVSNVNQPVSVFENTGGLNKGHFLQIEFDGPQGNKFGVGAYVVAFVDNTTLRVDQMPIRGFQSSMDYKITLGLGENDMVDSLLVVWPDDRTETFRNVSADRLIRVKHTNSNFVERSRTEMPLIFSSVDIGQMLHRENDFIEFDRERLLYQMLSTAGPAFAQADLNGDGRDDVFLGSGKGHISRIFFQTSDGKFRADVIYSFAGDSLAEDVDAVFFDADSDGDQDLYVVTGGTDNLATNANQLDRFYENEGMEFSRVKWKMRNDRIPQFYRNGSKVKPLDFDRDGDLDLIVGTRSLPGYYGKPCDQLLLVNDGRGKFEDKTAEYAPDFLALGMVTDLEVFDDDNDGYPEVIFVGDWMPITFFDNRRGRLEKKDVPSLKDTQGWWNSVHSADIDEDGDVDFVLGNLGWNSKMRPSATEPVKMYLADFDNNGSLEQIYTRMVGKQEIVMTLRQDIVKQIPSLKKKFIYYADYADKGIDDIFDESQMKNVEVLTSKVCASSLLVNLGVGNFELRELPADAQVGPVYDATTLDVNKDGQMDVLLVGNLYEVKPELGRFDGLKPTVLIRKLEGYEAVEHYRSGIDVDGQFRHVRIFRSRDQIRVGLVRNDGPVSFFKLN